MVALFSDLEQSLLQVSECQVSCHRMHTGSQAD